MAADGTLQSIKNASATVTGVAVSFHNHTTADAFKAMADLP